MAIWNLAKAAGKQMKFLGIGEKEANAMEKYVHENVGGKLSEKALRRDYWDKNLSSSYEDRYFKEQRKFAQKNRTNEANEKRRDDNIASRVQKHKAALERESKASIANALEENGITVNKAPVGRTAPTKEIHKSSRERRKEILDDMNAGKTSTIPEEPEVPQKKESNGHRRRREKQERKEKARAEVEERRKQKAQSAPIETHSDASPELGLKTPGKAMEGAQEKAVEKAEGDKSTISGGENSSPKISGFSYDEEFGTKLDGMAKDKSRNRAERYASKRAAQSYREYTDQYADWAKDGAPDQEKLAALNKKYGVSGDKDKMEEHFINRASKPGVGDYIGGYDAIPVATSSVVLGGAVSSVFSNKGQRSNADLYGDPFTGQ